MLADRTSRKDFEDATLRPSLIAPRAHVRPGRQVRALGQPPTRPPPRPPPAARAADTQAAAAQAKAQAHQLKRMTERHWNGLILSDIMMPRLDGLGLLHAVQPTRLCSVTFPSARAGPEASANGIEAGPVQPLNQ